METQKLNGKAVVYKEDVAEALGCCASTALTIMKRTGKTVMVGRRLAMYVSDFYSMLSSDEHIGLSRR